MPTATAATCFRLNRNLSQTHLLTFKTLASRHRCARNQTKRPKTLAELGVCQSRLTHYKYLPKSKEDYCRVKTFTATASQQKVGSRESLDTLTQSGLDLRLAKRLNYSGIQIFGFLGRVCSRSSAITNK